VGNKKGLITIPQWMNLQSIHIDIKNIESELDELKKLHTKNPEVISKNNDDTIDLTTKNVIIKIRSLQELVSKIGKDKKLSYRENLIKENIQKNFVNLLQKLSMRLNNTQKNHLQQVNNQKERMSGLQEDSDSDHENKGWMYKGVQGSSIPLSQMTQLDSDKELINERNIEIERITSQIKEISQIFIDLAQMIQNQGSILDRIDENIASSVTNMDQGVGALGQINQKQIIEKGY